MLSRWIIPVMITPIQYSLKVLLTVLFGLLIFGIITNNFSNITSVNSDYSSADNKNLSDQSSINDNTTPSSKSFLNAQSFTREQIRELADQRSSYKDSPLDSYEERILVIENIIDTDLLAQEALRSNLHQQTDIIWQTKKLLADKWITILRDNVTLEDITDDEIYEYYRQNRALFVKKEKVKVSYINASDRRTIDELRLKLNSNKIENSHDTIVGHWATSSIDVIDYEFFTRSTTGIDERIKQLAFSLTDSQPVSASFKHQNRWGILLREDYQPASNQSQEDVYSSIRQKLLKQKQYLAVKNHIEELRKNISH